MPRRQHLSVLVIAAVLAFLTLSFLLSSHRTTGDAKAPYKSSLSGLTDSHLHGEATAPKLENATLKAELGNAAWKVLHTTMAKFPDKPTAEDSASLEAYIYLFARLYPCGECARHFQTLLAKFPPQTGSRSSAAAWACHVHNQVNKRLQKEEFDCSKIGDFYDCGCADEEEGKGDKGGMETVEKTERFTPLELEKEGITRGG